MITGSEAMIVAQQNDLASQLSDDPLGAAAEYYASCLGGHASVLEIAMSHFAMTVEQLAQARIGYADRSLGTQIPSARSAAGKRLRAQLTEAGLYKANGRETLRGYLTEPLVDASGQIVGIRGTRLHRSTAGPAQLLVGRSLRTDEQDGAPEHVVSPEPVVEAEHTIDPERPAGQEDDLTATENTPSPRLDGLRVEGDKIHWTVDDRSYRVGGLSHNATLWSLKVNLLVSRQSLVHLDLIDLVKARSRENFAKAAADALFVPPETIRKDLGRLLMLLESFQGERLEQATRRAKPAEMTSAQREEALCLLRDPELCGRISHDLEACGCVGQGIGKLAIYLAATSRLLPRPLAMVVQSSSAAGKSSLLDGVLSLMPEEAYLRLSNLSAQSLYYLGADSLSHRTLAISEQGGMHSVAYPLKLLQSEGTLRHAAVVKGQAGRLRTEQYEVTGPIQLMLTTTALELDEELLNRCLVVSVDESRSQTQAILDYQRRMRCFGQREVAQSTRQRIHLLHHHAQRLLRPLWVNNPFAPQLTFSDTRTRIRRDHEKYLTLIDTICLLHQHQREIHSFTSAQGEVVEYINVTRGDIELAGRIAGELLGRSLDELSPQTRRFLEQLHGWIIGRMRAEQLPQSAIRFTRRELRGALPWSDWQLRQHLAKLIAMEYILVHRGTNGRSFVYELLYDGRGQDGEPFVIGLVDAQRLQAPSREDLHPPQRQPCNGSSHPGKTPQHSAPPASLSPPCGDLVVLSG
jgi:hypothetical protein